MSLTHFDAQGQAHMVDVGPKTTTHRIAVASGDITMLPATLALIESGNAKKGDVIGIARIAGIQAAKKTSDLIPLCHPLMISKAEVDFMPVMLKRLTLTGSTLRSRPADEKARLARQVETLVWPWIAAGSVTPRIEAVFPLAKAADAHRRLETGDHVGKIVLQP